MTETKTLQHRIDGPAGAPCLVLGPALGTTWHMWDRQIPELTRHWRVVRFDLPGHGGAPAHPASAVDELAERVLATLDAAGVEQFAYVGCSLGAAVGARLALDHATRVTSLVLIAAARRFDTADAWRQRGVVVRTNGLDPIASSIPERWFTREFATVQTAIRDWAVQMVRTTDPGCYIAACEAFANFDISGELGRVSAPTLVVAGAEDRLTPPAEARALVAGIPDARLALVPGAAHLVPVEQPTRVTELVTHHVATAWRELPTSRSQPIPTGTSDTGPSDAVAPAAVAELPAAEPTGADDPYQAGMKIRREVLGDAHVDQALAEAGDLGADFETFVTRYAWGEVWARPGLERSTRSVVALAALTARGHLDALASHVRAALRNGLTPAEIREVLWQTAVHCGVPAAQAAFAVARRVIAEETTLPD